MIVEQYSDDSLEHVKPESSLSGKLGHVAVC